MTTLKKGVAKPSGTARKTNKKSPKPSSALKRFDVSKRQASLSKESLSTYTLSKSTITRALEELNQCTFFISYPSKHCLNMNIMHDTNDRTSNLSSFATACCKTEIHAVC